MIILEMRNQHTCLVTIPRNMTALHSFFSLRIILNRSDPTSQAAILRERCSALKYAGHYKHYAPFSQSGHVAATHPWDIFVCVQMLGFSPCFMSPQCALHRFLSLQHVTETWPLATNLPPCGALMGNFDKSP